MTESQDEVAIAQAAVDEADAGVRQTEVALLNEPPTATGAQLVEAESRLSKAKAALARAVDFQSRRSVAKAEKVRISRAADLVDTVLTWGGTTEVEVSAAFAVAVDAAAALASKIDAYGGRLTTLADELRTVAPLDDHRVIVYPSGARVDVLVPGPDGPERLQIDPYSVTDLLADAVALGVAKARGTHPDTGNTNVVQTPASSVPDDTGVTVTVGTATYHSRIERTARRRARLIATTGTTEKD